MIRIVIMQHIRLQIQDRNDVFYRNHSVLFDWFEWWRRGARACARAPLHFLEKQQLSFCAALRGGRGRNKEGEVKAG